MKLSWQDSRAFINSDSLEGSTVLMPPWLTHTDRYTDRQLLTGYTISSASSATNWTIYDCASVMA